MLFRSKEIAPKVGTESDAALLHDYKQFYSEGSNSTLRAGRGRTAIGLARIASNILDAGLFALTVDDAYNMGIDKVDSKEYKNRISEDLNPFILLNLNLDPEYEYTAENAPYELNQIVKQITGKDLHKQAEFKRKNTAQSKEQIGRTYKEKDGKIYTKDGVQYFEYSNEGQLKNKDKFNTSSYTTSQQLMKNIVKDVEYAYDLFDVTANYQIQTQPIGMVSKRSKTVM